MKRFVAVTAFLALLALPACGAQQTKNENSKNAQGDVNAAQISRKRQSIGEVSSIKQRYHCDNGRDVFAQYSGAGDNASTRVTIGDKTYDLYSIVSASGAKYGTEHGPRPDHLFVWWTKGDEASWYESPLDDSAKPSNEKMVATCKKPA
jgi:membrane-bound inhibitor of C-type lysozyme